MRRAIASAVTAIVLLGGAAAPATAAPTVVTGQWQCDDRGAIGPLDGIEVQLWRRGWDWFPAEVTGGIDARGFTDADGRFSLRATDGEDTHFVRMALRDAAGVHLKDFWGINDWSIDSAGLRNDVPARTVGGLLLSTPGQSHKCAIWRGFHRAHADFRAETGVNPPSGGLTINADAITAGVPFTPHTTVMWPGGFQAGYGAAPDDTITRHEFGHVIRHGYDGDLGHFLGDVIAHNYLQNHESCNKTGLGFAFNEGWAEYWARDYAPAPSCAGRAPDDYEVEGNVAAALTDLAARCYAGRRAPMVDVLRAHPGAIHSFREFLALAPCPAPVSAAPPPPVRTAPLRPVTLGAAARAALSQVRAVDARLRGLRSQLRSAVRAARSIPACTTSPCTAALRRATLPSALGIEIGLAQVVRDTVGKGDTATEQRRRRKLGIAVALRLMKAEEKADRARAAGVLARGTAGALSAARPIFKQDTSSATRRIRSLMLARLATFRRAQKGGRAAGIVIDQAIGERIRKVAARTFPVMTPTPTPAPTPTPTPAPAPTPGPNPDQRAASTLTLTCPAGGKPGGSAALSGTLTPARPGVEVEVHITSPGGAETIQRTTTNANSAYQTTATLATSGTWKFFARWAGDAELLPDDSPTCEVTV